MREIKFRIFDKLENEIHIFGEDIHDEIIIGSRNELQYYNLQTGESSDEKGDYILMEYTGMKDEEGVEIYESDIVEFFCQSEPEKNYGKVVWNGGGWDLCVVRKDQNIFYSEYVDLFRLLYLKKCKVIGNIYENPELLDKKTGKGGLYGKK